MLLEISPRLLILFPSFSFSLSQTPVENEEQLGCTTIFLFETISSCIYFRLGHNDHHSMKHVSYWRLPISSKRVVYGAIQVKSVLTKQIDTEVVFDFRSNSNEIYESSLFIAQIVSICYLFNKLQFNSINLLPMSL